jgi:hypothetical protein
VSDTPLPLYGSSFWQNWLAHLKNRMPTGGNLPNERTNDNSPGAPLPPKPMAQLDPAVLQRLQQYTYPGGQA